MVDVEHPVIKDRQIEYEADEISFLNFVITDYSNPIAPEPETYANYEFDTKTKQEV
jgi:hypothetical protein